MCQLSEITIVSPQGFLVVRIVTIIGKASIKDGQEAPAVVQSINQMPSLGNTWITENDTSGKHDHSGQMHCKQQILLGLSA